jgi:hypothetical protein
MGRSPDIETVPKKSVEFSKNFKMGGHLILRPFLRKVWSFLRI